jgi:hypothetical protein
MPSLLLLLQAWLHTKVLLNYAAAAAAARIMMAAISKLVAVIPVIAKADTFTAQEMEQFRQELLQVCYFRKSMNAIVKSDSHLMCAIC